MGLFGGGNKQSTSISNEVTNISDDSTRVVQDSYNQISSTTTEVNAAFSGNAFGTQISQPIAILANGSDGANFDANQFFKDASIAPGSDTGQKSNALFGFLVLALVVLVAYRFLRKKK